MKVIPILAFLLFAGYFFPTIVAALRRKSNTLAITVLNIFLGWTLIGWVVALVWACTHEKRPSEII